MNGLYRGLLRCYGAQGWWPAADRFEMMIGAVLVQNTAWPNAQRAVAALRAAGLLQWRRLAQAEPARLAAAIRPAGTYRVKARRVLALARHVAAHGGPDALDAWPTDALRAGLLAVHGVGAETADAILVYAYARPSFILDAYTRRLCTRLGLLPATFEDARPCDAALRAMFEQALPRDAALYGEFHALIVAHGKTYCRASPQCSQCPLRRGCAFFAAGAPDRSAPISAR